MAPPVVASISVQASKGRVRFMTSAKSEGAVGNPPESCKSRASIGTTPATGRSGGLVASVGLAVCQQALALGGELGITARESEQVGQGGNRDDRQPVVGRDRLCR